MTEKYDSKFHKLYVGGDGEVTDTPLMTMGRQEYPRISYEDVLVEYRKYIGDSSAELPEIVIEQMKNLGLI